AVAAVNDGPVLAQEGRVYVFNGGATGLAPTPSRIIAGGQAGAALGSGIGGGGDVNADPSHDLMLGAATFDGDLSNEGHAALYAGAPDPTTYTFRKLWDLGTPQDFVNVLLNDADDIGYDVRSNAGSYEVHAVRHGGVHNLVAS